MTLRRNGLKSKPARAKTKDLLLRDPNFVAKSLNASFEAPPLACEASALTTELTAPNHIYFTPKNQLCKHRPLASPTFWRDKMITTQPAELLMADLIPQAHLREAENRVKQRVIRHQAFMVAMRTQVNCRIHDLVDSQLLPAEVL